MSPPEQAGLPGKEALSARLYYKKCTRIVSDNVFGAGGYLICFFFFSMLLIYLELGPFPCCDAFSDHLQYLGQEWTLILFLWFHCLLH